MPLITKGERAKESEKKMKKIESPNKNPRTEGLKQSTLVAGKIPYRGDTIYY